MENQLKLTPFEHGLGIEFENERFVFSFAQTRGPWDTGKEWTAERNAEMPTPMQGIVLEEFRDEINAKLAELEKEEYGGLWTNRPHATRKDCAWAVLMYNGNVDWLHRLSYYDVRAVTAFPDDVE